MRFSVRDVVPFTQARANLSELAEQAKAGSEKIITKNGESYVALIDADTMRHYAPGMPHAARMNISPDI